MPPRATLQKAAKCSSAPNRKKTGVCTQTVSASAGTKSPDRLLGFAPGFYCEHSSRLLGCRPKDNFWLHHWL